MEEKTGLQIYNEMLDLMEANWKSDYNDETSKARKEFEEKKWIISEGK